MYLAVGIRHDRHVDGVQGARGVPARGERAPAGDPGVGAGIPVLALHRHCRGLDGPKKVYFEIS